MKTFNIYVNEMTKETQAVKNGFSFPGFFFNWIWALIKGMVGLGIGLLILPMIAGFMLGLFLGEIGVALSWMMNIGICIYCGVKGNELVGSSLLSKGFQLKDTVTSGSPEQALASYIASQDK